MEKGEQVWAFLRQQAEERKRNRTRDIFLVALPKEVLSIVQHLIYRDTSFVATGTTQRKRAHAMKLGILGTGHVALLLAAAWHKAGHDITLGSRDPGSKQVDFPVKTLVEAASWADIIINAILGSAALEMLMSRHPGGKLALIPEQEDP